VPLPFHFTVIEHPPAEGFFFRFTTRIRPSPTSAKELSHHMGWKFVKISSLKAPTWLFFRQTNPFFASVCYAFPPLPSEVMNFSGILYGNLGCCLLCSSSLRPSFKSPQESFFPPLFIALPVRNEMYSRPICFFLIERSRSLLFLRENLTNIDLRPSLIFLSCPFQLGLTASYDRSL